MSCRLKPGSLHLDGSVVDYRGVVHTEGPCFIPKDVGIQGGWDRQLPRRNLLSAAGWRYTGAVNWPGLKPNDNVVCIDRVGRMPCNHDWRYEGTDYHGSHKGEAVYRCPKCLVQEYRL